jgi:Tol biopolymer transport system component
MSSSSLPALTWLTQDSNYVDYRPVVNAAGDTVIFERTPMTGGGPTTLQVIDDFSNPNPAPFLSGSPPASQTRPDWLWQGGDSVLFNGATSNNAAVSVWLAAADGSNPQPISGTTGAYYPRWNVGGGTFVTENSGSTAKPTPPCNTIFNLDGSVNSGNGNIDGNDTLNKPMYGGMPGVCPKGLPAIAYAGQPVITGGWIPGYNEDFNYVFLNSFINGAYSSAPMEGDDVPLTAFNAAYQGRAPDWSPDGTTIAFESNRSGMGYAIYLYQPQVGGTPIMVTDPTLNAQHARFFPDGSKLIVGIRMSCSSRAMGIAWIDVSSLL